jgi:hypothetical protein
MTVDPAIMKAISEMPDGELHPVQIEMLQKAVERGGLDKIFAVALAAGDEATVKYIATNLSQHLSPPLQQMCVKIRNQFH